jgi:hypothetical protein
MWIPVLYIALYLRRRNGKKRKHVVTGTMETSMIQDEERR